LVIGSIDQKSKEGKCVREFVQSAGETMANRCLLEDDNEDANHSAKSVGRQVRQKLFEQRQNKLIKKFSSALTGEKEMQELMRLAEYEVAKDPYRGIGFLTNSNNNQIEDGKKETTTNFSHGEGKRVNKVVTPWDVCQWGFLSTQQREKEKRCTDNTRIQDNDKENLTLLDQENVFDLVRNTTESCCPSIVSWTREHLKEQHRKKQQSQKNKKKRNTTLKKRKQSACGEQINNTLGCTKSPHLGIRPSSMKYRCPCDSNPFCLGSMGGVMNDLLKETSEIGTIISITNEDRIVYDENDSQGIKSTNSVNFRGDSNHNDWKNRTGHGAEIETVDMDQKKSTSSLRMESKEYKSTLKTMEKNKTSSDFRKKTQPSASPIVTHERLSLGRKLELAKPEELYFPVGDISEQKSYEESYSQTTKNEIKKLRRFEKLDVSKIKKFIENIFKSYDDSKANKNAMELDDYIQTMIEWHKSLLFMDPISKTRHLSSTLVRIALPPGIENLGATCYLNTQLQCIAQNPVFLDGIFSWRPLNATHMMNEVMKKLQKLLGQMLVGGDCKYTSLDFSNALGIQHNEQQDPNEFARLLFDRMEESFQQCSINNSDDADGENSLGTLLQRIFHGTTTYETVCMKCRKRSVRTEGFMDLNLPIVQRQKCQENNIEDLNDNNSATQFGKDPSFVKRKRKRTIKNVKRRKNNLAETDVQYCFDQYIKPEVLSGDNQYFCEACNCKQDAMRIMSLTKLPPVLNVQLSRYVFDRKKFVKKKRMDKVRLPTILSVVQHDTAGTAGISKIERPPEKKYLLCAVMKHQGNSAYSGHYVAEAMDWTMGQWYEFNDECVKIIPAPSNSYIPVKFLDSNEKKIEITTESDGSQDAYNLYYVDERYLSKIAMSTMIRNRHLYFVHNGSNKRESRDMDVLSNLIREKVQRYSVLTELCKVDFAVSERLMMRKDGIRKFMFSNPNSLLLQEGQKKEDNEPYFWVDGKSLRQFVACDSSLDDKLKSDDPIICPKSMLCIHGHLHPRNARRGKILRKSFYDSYVSILSEERKCMSISGSVNERDIIGCMISSEEGMTCDQCAECYRNDLSKKLDFLKTIIDLYVDVKDEAKDLTKGTTKDSTKQDINRHEYSFVVTRSSIAKFKKLVVDLFKAVADFWEGTYLNHSTINFESRNKTILEGIDDLDLSCFPGGPTYRGYRSENDLEIMEMHDSVDEKFNSKITCPHGNCNEFSLRIVRYVPYKTWAMIKKVYPSAIEHKVSIHSPDGKLRKPNIKDDGCPYCCREREAVKSLISDIEKWAMKTEANAALKELLDRKKILTGDTLLHNFDKAQNNCRLVHTDDMTIFCKSVRLLGRLSKTKLPEISKVKTHVENIAFPRYHVLPNSEKQPEKRLLHSLRSLTCCDHKRAIKSAMIDNFKNDGEIQERYSLSKSISVLSEEEYISYINALSELLIILDCDYQNNEIVEETLQDNPSSMFDNIKAFGALCHPKIKVRVGGKTSADQILLFSLDGNSKEISFVPEICAHEACKNDFVPVIQKSAKMAIESISADTRSEGFSDRHKDARRKTKCRIGSIARSPIIVKSDSEDRTDVTENMQNIRIFQYETRSELQDVIQYLRTAVGFSSIENNDASNFGLRRSMRKRKAKFPIGCITCEYKLNIGLHQNVAALRLLLYQNCQIPLGSKLSMVMLFNEKPHHKCIEISFDRSEKSLSDLVDELKISGTECKLLESKANENFYLLCQLDNDEKSGDTDTDLIDSMLQISNIQYPDKKSFGGETKCRRGSERGFQGTLLVSSRTTNNGEDQMSKVSDGSIIVLDDELLEMPTQSITVSDMKDTDSSSKGAKQPSKIHFQKMKIAVMLMQLTESKDESGCYEAVSLAMKSNPKYNEEEIIDVALNRLFENASHLMTE